MQKVIYFLHILFLLGVASNAKAQIDTDRVLIIGRNALYYEDYVLAISYFNKVIRVKPYLADPYYFRAFAKYSLEDLKGAEKDMDKAISVSPFQAGFYRFRGDIRSKFGAYDEALNDYAKGLELSPQEEGIFFNRGLVYMNTKEYQKSVDDFTEVLKIDNAQYGAYINRAISKLQLKDTIGAVKDMDEAIEVNPLVADAYRFSAIIYYETNDFDKALARINEAIELNRNDAGYYMMRGVIRYQMDNLAGTMSDFDQVIELDPKNTMAYANRGILRVEVGDVNNAIDDFSRVLALNPGDLLTLFNRSLLYIRVGQYREAIADLNVIIQRYPDYPDAYMARSQAYSGINNNMAAGRDYNMAFKLDQDSRKKAEREPEKKKTVNDGDKPKKTRSEKDDDISNHDKIAVLDDFGIDETEVEEIDNLRGKIQNRNIVIDLETVYGLTFFSVDSLINRTRYFKTDVTQFNQHKKFGRPLIFSNREAETDGSKSLEYFTSIKEIGTQIEQTPSDYELRFIRAILYGVVLNYTSAITEYDFIIENTEDKKLNLFAYFNRAYIRYKMVEMMQTFDDVELPSSLISKPLTSVVNKDKVAKEDVIIKQSLDYELIERDLQKVLELDPEYEFAYYNLGILQCIRKDYEGAIVYFEKAIALNPFFAEAYFNRGLTRIYLKQDELGTLDLSKAGELGMYKAYNVIKRYGMQREVKEEEETK